MKRNQILSIVLVLFTLGIIYFIAGGEEKEETGRRRKVISYQEQIRTEDKQNTKATKVNTESKEIRKNTNESLELDELLDDISDQITDCQKTVEKLFPENDDGSLPYKTASEVKNALSKFYKVTNDKLDNVGKVVKFLENADSSKLDAKKTFENISNIDDCGDFEEENIIDSVVSFLSEYTFSQAEKKSIAKHLINSFLTQINKPIGLHHIVSKVESIETMIDEEIIPPSLEADLERMNQTLEDIESDFRAVIPKDFATKDFFTPEEILLLKSREDEVIEKIKIPLKEFLSQIQEELSR